MNEVRIIIGTHVRNMIIETGILDAAAAKAAIFAGGTDSIIAAASKGTWTKNVGGVDLVGYFSRGVLHIAVSDGWMSEYEREARAAAKRAEMFVS